MVGTTVVSVVVGVVVVAVFVLAGGCEGDVTLTALVSVCLLIYSQGFERKGNWAAYMA